MPLTYDSSKSQPYQRAKYKLVNPLVKFMEYAWSLQNISPDPEVRIGILGQFYVSLAAYIENYLWAIMNIRTEAILMFKHVELSKVNPIVDGVSCGDRDMSDIRDMLVNHFSKELCKVEIMSMDELKAAYNLVHKVRLDDVLSKREMNDLNALFGVRNAFAHGTMVMYEIHKQNLTEKYPERHLGKAVNYLKSIGKLPNDTKLQFLILFSEDVVKYFYGAVKAIQKSLYVSVTDIDEKAVLDNLNYPELLELKPIPKFGPDLQN